MSRILVTAFLTLLIVQPAWPQDDESPPAAEARDDAGTPPADAAGSETAGGGEAAAGGSEGDAAAPDAELEENPELDRQTHEKDDDEFVPTEEIPVDESIPFPTDI